MLTYYREPYCYELDGLSLRCRHTGGAQMTLSFRRSTLTILRVNEQTEQSYTCQKADDGLYFVHSEALYLTLDLLHGQGCLHSQAQPGRLSPLCLDGGAGFPPLRQSAEAPYALAADGASPSHASHLSCWRGGSPP